MASLLPGSVAEMASKVLGSAESHPRAERAAQMITTKSKDDPSGRTMQAVLYNGKRSVIVNEIPKPTITDPKDVIVRMTSTAICGTDLHIYVNSLPGVSSGQVLGHESMGIVEEVGDQVKNIKRGDRVVASAILACGQCYFCKRQEFDACDMTNPSVTSEVSFELLCNVTKFSVAYTERTNYFNLRRK
jgi:threonine dehydrogenase-like Zn-dependent dehydrogenase